MDNGISFWASISKAAINLVMFGIFPALAAFAVIQNYVGVIDAESYKRGATMVQCMIIGGDAMECQILSHIYHGDFGDHGTVDLLNPHETVIKRQIKESAE
jgi:hypothetical protein